MTRFFLTTCAFIAFATSSQLVHADAAKPASGDDFTWGEFRLSNEQTPSANAEPAKRPLSTSARLRQQRALYRDQQRVARIEANAWIGHEPLRPAWSSVPMMASRYPERQTVVIPVFVP
jgi:hypothetical protein